MKVIGCLAYCSFLLVGSFLPLKVLGQDLANKPPIILSSRWFHPAYKGDTLNTLKMVDLYKPDHIDWMYCEDSSKLKLLQNRGIKYSLALNPQIPDSLGYTVKGRIIDANGNKLGAPWMRKWSLKNPYWGCVNSPEFKDIFYKKSELLIDLGAYGLFVDDARLNDQAIDFGGCYCEYCMKAFTKYLSSENLTKVSKSFDYKEYLVQGLKTKSSDSTKIFIEKFRKFQHDSVVSFLTEWKKQMLKYSKTPISFLTNNYLGQWTDIYQVFDIGIAELSIDSLDNDSWIKGISKAKKLGKKQYYTLASNNSEAQVEAIFLTYFEGSALIIPWDVFAPVTSAVASRFYGATNNFLPVYNFIKDNSTNFYNCKRISSSDFPLKISGSEELVKTRIYKVNNKFMVLIQFNNKGVTTHDLTIKSSKQLMSSNIKTIYPEVSSIKNTLPNQLKLNFTSNIILLEINN